jgi:hypothetical protein
MKTFHKIVSANLALAKECEQKTGRTISKSEICWLCDAELEAIVDIRSDINYYENWVLADIIDDDLPF